MQGTEPNVCDLKVLQNNCDVFLLTAKPNLKVHSLPFSQEPTTGPCPEPDESSPHLPSHQMIFIIITIRYYIG
jgi:hypothetical protein